MRFIINFIINTLVLPFILILALFLLLRSIFGTVIVSLVALYNGLDALDLLKELHGVQISASVNQIEEDE